MIADILIRLLVWCARKTPPRVITGRGNDTPYLTRYFLSRHGPLSEGMDHEGLLPKWGHLPKWGLYLHHFHRGDDDGALHSHPWRWAYSLVLKGGYWEERRFRCPLCKDGEPQCSANGTVFRRIVRPWTINKLTDKDFHRVDLLDPDGAWTLFLVGPVVKSWGFWDRGTVEYTPWKKFLGIEQ